MLRNKFHLAIDFVKELCYSSNKDRLLIRNGGLRRRCLFDYIWRLFFHGPSLRSRWWLFLLGRIS